MRAEEDKQKTWFFAWFKPLIFGEGMLGCFLSMQAATQRSKATSSLLVSAQYYLCLLTITFAFNYVFSSEIPFQQNVGRDVVDW